MEFIAAVARYHVAEASAISAAATGRTNPLWDGRGARGFLVVFDLTDRASFREAEAAVQAIVERFEYDASSRRRCPLAIVLAGNKADLTPGNERTISLDEVVKDAEGQPVELRRTYDPETRAGAGQKVKGIIHWVSAAHAVPARVRLLRGCRRRRRRGGARRRRRPLRGPGRRLRRVGRRQAVRAEPEVHGADLRAVVRLVRRQD